MKTFKYQIKSSEGLHATPAGTIVSIAKCFPGKITLIYNDQKINLKKLLPFLGANIKKDDIIEVQIEGNQEEACCESLLEAFKETL